MKPILQDRLANLCTVMRLDSESDLKDIMSESAIIQHYIKLIHEDVKNRGDEGTLDEYFNAPSDDEQEDMSQKIQTVENVD